MACPTTVLTVPDTNHLFQGHPQQGMHRLQRWPSCCTLVATCEPKSNQFVTCPSVDPWSQNGSGQVIFPRKRNQELRQQDSSLGVTINGVRDDCWSPSRDLQPRSQGTHRCAYGSRVHEHMLRPQSGGTNASTWRRTTPKENTSADVRMRPPSPNSGAQYLKHGNRESRIVNL
jgi:hypothetical protein